MRRSIEQRIVDLRNEVRALKATAIFSGENVPVYENRVEWSGEIDGSEAMEGMVVAAFEMKFTRTDGIKKTPLVDFAFDTNPITKSVDLGCVIKCTDDSVNYHIVFDSNSFDAFIRRWDNGSSQYYIDGHLHLIITGAAYSIVPGTLSIDRVYSWI